MPSRKVTLCRMHAICTLVKVQVGLAYSSQAPLIDECRYVRKILVVSRQLARRAAVQVIPPYAYEQALPFRLLLTAGSLEMLQASAVFVNGLPLGLLTL